MPREHVTFNKRRIAISRPFSNIKAAVLLTDPTDKKRIHENADEKQKKNSLMNHSRWPKRWKWNRSLHHTYISRSVTYNATSVKFLISPLLPMTNDIVLRFGAICTTRQCRYVCLWGGVRGWYVHIGMHDTYNVHIGFGYNTATSNDIR